MKHIFVNAVVTLLISLGVATYTLDYGLMPSPYQATHFLFLAAGTCPGGWVQDTSFDGQYLRITVAAHANVGTTGGSGTLTATGSVTAPTLTMNSYTPAGTNGTVAFTPAGTNSAPALTMNSYTPAGTNGTVAFTPVGTNGTGTVTATGTIAWPTATPIVTMGKVTDVPAHTHGQQIRNTGTAGTVGTQGASTSNNVSVGATDSTGLAYVQDSGAIIWPTVAAKYGIGQTSSGLSGTTVATAAFKLPTIAGHLIVGFTSWDNTSSQTLTSVTDTEGNSYTLISTGLAPDTTHHQAFEIFYAYNITGGTTSNIVTAHFSASVSGTAIGAMEVAGIKADGDPLDKSGYQFQSSTTTPTAPSATVTPTTNGQFIFGGSNNSGGGTTAWTATGAFYLDEVSTSNISAMEHQVQTTAAAVQATFSNTSNSYVTGVATFKAATSSVPTFTGTSATTSAQTFTGSSGTVPAEAFTGTPAVLTGSVAAPAFTGSSGTVPAEAFTGTPATLTGSNSTPVFTGNAVTNTPSYVNLILCKPAAPEQVPAASAVPAGGPMPQRRSDLPGQIQ